MSSASLQNRTFDEICTGDTASVTRVLTARDIQLFAAVSGDLNPSHLDPEFVRRSGGGEVTGHSMWLGSLVSGLLGNELPGPGTRYLGQNLEFHAYPQVGDTLTVTITAENKHGETRSVGFACRCTNQRGETLMSGTARVTAPTEKIVVERPDDGQVAVQTHDKLSRFIERCSELPTVAAAVAHPCDASSLGAAVEAARHHLLAPILVGPADKIRAVAAEHGLDLSGLRIEDVPHSHAAAVRAVELVRAGEAAVLMKGSLHTDELMSAVVKRDTGLRTERRISHVFLMDVPTYHKPLLVTDAAVNIAPDLETKVHICQNAIDLAHILGIARPKVAILSAVETINPKMISTTEAASLCKMADRGQITGAILDGPLALDNAISLEAARIKKIDSPVAGDPDILVVPDLEAGNILAKQLTFISQADAAGIVLGARVPIVLTSRADDLRTKLASCAVASLMANARSGITPGKG